MHLLGGCQGYERRLTRYDDCQRSILIIKKKLLSNKIFECSEIFKLYIQISLSARVPLCALKVTSLYRGVGGSVTGHGERSLGCWVHSESLISELLTLVLNTGAEG